MDLKGAEIRNLEDLCMAIGSRESVPLKVKIPHYQRPYKWDELRIKNLFSDYFKSDEKEYFIGSVVMVEEKDGNFDIIDGQQRTTTLFLLNFMKFVFLRAYIEELLIVGKTTKIDTLLLDLEKTARNLFDENKVNKLIEVHSSIEKILDQISDEEDSEQKEYLYEKVLREFQKTTGLPEKNQSDNDTYLNLYMNAFGEFLRNCQLSLKYERSLYNEKIKQAMKRCVIELSASKNPKFVSKMDSIDPVIEQYIKALHYEFNGLTEHCVNKGESPLEYTAMIIKAIEGMLKKIKVCVIITGNENDAYTLFEVLNDRSMAIEDLDLIKNLFYKWYCNNTTDSDFLIDKNIEKADEIWVEEVFSSSTGKEQAKLISFLAAEYFTADDALKFNDTARYRESIEKNYLERCKPYNGTNLMNDISIYQMLSIMLKDIDFKYQKKAEKVLASECDGMKSITYRTLNLLHALKLYGVLPAITNIIIRKYIDLQKDTCDTEINIKKFQEFMKGLIDSTQQNDERYKDIHRVAYDFWRYALLAKNAELPRQIAKKIISRNHMFSSDIQYKVSSYDSQIKGEFTEWINNWKYGSGDSQLKVKVLFINLFETNKQDNQLSLLATRTKFATTEIQLDHMEAQHPSAVAREKYFEPTDSNEAREAYIHSIGNIMIMDREGNDEKNNLPLSDALRFYDEMSPNHWMITEVKEMLKDDKYSKEVLIVDEIYRVPKAEFFTERRARLLKYFSALLHRELDEITVSI
ncbi:MAG: DUF262 domain-containing protein [Lachnospiraceae bacterium]|nr:DUF262 domain-containing protein [Lachnospiraceae bacterium]